MNWFHNRYCASGKWRSTMLGEILPWVLGSQELAGRVLEVGPGPGIVTEALVEYGLDDLTTLEIEPGAADRLRERFGDQVTVTTGDAAAMDLPDGEFDWVVCLTMLHHVPTVEQQDSLFREASRVLRPGGALIGSDTRPSLLIRLYHLNDTFNPVDPVTLEGRLRRAGFDGVGVDATDGRFRFRAVKV